MQVKHCINCMEEIEGDSCPSCGCDQSIGDTQPQTTLKCNTVLHGRYLVGRVLGQGGFGITYIGFDLLLNIKVAIKEYFPMGVVSRDNKTSNILHWSSSLSKKEQWKDGCEGFLKEARKMAKIDSISGVVRVRDTFYENQTSYIVMDFIEGITLKKFLLKNGPMNYERCIQMLSPLMNSLCKVHANGLIHRDISPDNIMIHNDGSPKLLDLGAAKDLSVNKEGVSQLVTKRGFSPAEQYMESGSVGAWTDVYAFCATMYYCIYGKVIPDAMERVMQDSLAFPATRKGGALPEDVVNTLRSGLAVRVEDRIQSMDELLARFAPYIDMGNAELLAAIDMYVRTAQTKSGKKEKQKAKQKVKKETKQDTKQEAKKETKQDTKQEAKKEAKQETKKETKQDIKQKIKSPRIIIPAVVAGVCVLVAIVYVILKNVAPFANHGLIYRKDGDTIVICGYRGHEKEVGIPYTIDGLPVVDIEMDNMPAECNYYMRVPENELGYISTNDGKGIIITAYIGDSTSIMLPDSIGGIPVTGIGSKAFEGKEIHKIALGKKITEIGGYAFSGCEKLTYVALPDKLATIGNCAFQWTGLSEIDLPKSLTYIGYLCFDGTHISNVSIPKNVSYIGWQAFPSLPVDGLSVDKGNKFYTVVDGVLYSKDMTVLVSCSGGKTGSFIIPATVKTIESHAFANCNWLTEIVVADGSSLETISEYAFYNCDGLTKIDLQSGGTVIKGKAIYNCSNMIELWLPRAVSYVPEDVCQGCDSLQLAVYSKACDCRMKFGRNVEIRYYKD